MGLFNASRLQQLQQQAQSSSQRQVVLVVDDEEANLQVMRSLLLPHYEVLSAGSGMDALRAIQQLPEPQRLACIISDQRMPGMSGVEMLIEASALAPLAMRIIVTGYSDVQATVDAINKAQIYRYLLKPFDANDFRLTVQRAVEAAELKRELDAYHNELEQKVAERTRELASQQASLLAAHEALRRSAAQITALYNNASCGYHSVDSKGLLLHINDTELAWLGWERGELVGKKRFQDIVTPASWDRFMTQHPEVVAGQWRHELHDVEFELVGRDGRVVPVLAHATGTFDNEEEPQCRFTVFDIRERKQNEERMRYLAGHDVLTGLPNRGLLLDRIEHDIVRAQRRGEAVAVLFVDVDHFKEVNDTHGHETGDALLRQVAARLASCVRKSDTLARLGGDEFVICIPDLADKAVATVVAEKVVASLRQPFFVDGQALKVSASVGVANYPDDAGDVRAIMRAADEAMYLSKRAGRDTFRVASGNGGG